MTPIAIIMKKGWGRFPKGSAPTKAVIPAKAGIYTMNKSEKIVILILSAALLAGSFILYKRHTRPFTEITIIKEGVKEELTLAQVEARLKEKRRVNINTATAEEITAIPGVGEVLAARIVEYRDSHGGFEFEEELLQVDGIGPKKLETIKEYIKIE